MINRGIKAENILLDSSPRPLTKLCDFGLSKHSYFQSAPQSRVGALHYLSPEMLVKGTLAPYSGEVRALLFISIPIRVDLLVLP